MDEGPLLIDPHLLNPHEKIDPFRAFLLLAKIAMDGKFIVPILIDVRSNTILDGHHRHWAAKVLGLKRIPCWPVDYLRDGSVLVSPRRARISVGKEEIIKRALEGNVYPYKTTRHNYIVPQARPFTLSELREKGR